MTSILCHLGDPRTAKPATTAEYGRIRERMILNPWVCLSESDFVTAITKDGCPFHGALMNGIDLYEFGSEVACWRMQTILGLDFDKCEVRAPFMVNILSVLGVRPWLGYHTFSHRSNASLSSYRLLWRVEADLNLQYKEVSTAFKTLNRLALSRGDKHAMNPTRLWQGTNSGYFHWDSEVAPLSICKLLGSASSIQYAREITNPLSSIIHCRRG